MNEILLLADWEVFPFFGIITILLSGVSAYLAWKDKKSIAIAGMVLALIVFSVFIAGMWMSQERPPMRTQGGPVSSTPSSLSFLVYWSTSDGATNGYLASAQS